MSDIERVSFRKPIQPAPRKAPKPTDSTWHGWTEAEDIIIRQHYPTGGIAACLAHLPAHRTPGGTYQRAALKLKLKAPYGKASNRNAGVNKQILAPEGIDDLLRDEWPKLSGKKRGEVHWLAERLKLPRWWLSARARKLGLAMPHKKEPPWTAAENALMERVPLHDVERCADIFRQHGFQRTPTAIMVRAKRINLSRRYTDTYSATAAGKILGVDAKTVIREILQGDMQATKRKTDRLPQQGGDPWSISRASLRQYIIDRLDRVDLRKVEKFEFVDVLVKTA